MKENEKYLLKMLKKDRGIEARILHDNDKFTFECDMCGECCTKDTIQTILFKPYDIYKISKAKNIKPFEVIKNYAEIYIGRNSGFPIARMLPNDKGECHFLAPKNTHSSRKICSISDSKPGSCSLYPLGRAVIKDKNDSSEMKESDILYFLQDIPCGKSKKNNTLNSWFNGHKEVEEFQLIYESNFFHKIATIINLHELNDFLKILDNEDPLFKMINVFYDSVINNYYAEYDTDKDFKLQYIKNIDTIMKIIERTTICIYLILRNRKNMNAKIGTCDINKVIDKIFNKDFIDNNENKILEQINDIQKFAEKFNLV